MVFPDCKTCADRHRRHWMSGFAILLSPLFWLRAVPAAVWRFSHRPSRQPRLCMLAGDRALRQDMVRALRRALAELSRFETKVPIDLILVQDRVTRADGEPLCVAVQRSGRGSAAQLTIRLSLHARGTCYGPQAVAATLVDTLVALYERETQASPVLEVPARTPREAPAAGSSRPAISASQNGVTGAGRSRVGLTTGATILAEARVDDEADGTVTQFKARPGGLSTNDHA